MSMRQVSSFPGANRVIVTTWVHGRTYDLNLFRLKTLVPTYSASVYSILCEKGKVDLLTGRGTTIISLLTQFRNMILVALHEKQCRILQPGKEGRTRKIKPMRPSFCCHEKCVTLVFNFFS